MWLVFCLGTKDATCICVRDKKLGEFVQVVFFSFLFLLHNF